jgi:hypothetical protein
MNDTGSEGQIVERIERPSPPAEAFGEFLMRALADPNIPADKLEIIAKMRREVLTDQAREAFMEHFAAFSSELPQVERDGTVELVKDGRVMGRYSFTTIEGMDIVLRPLLAKHGFAISFSSADNANGVTVTGTLSGWGYERSSTYTLPPDKGPGRNELQARGSSRRYAKRYVTDDLCNVVRKGKDDDARGAMEALIDAVQQQYLLDLIRETATDEVAFVKTMVSGAESLHDIRQRDYDRLIMALREKKQRRAKK